MSVRRAALFAVIVSFIAAVPASGATMPGAGAGVYQMADAAWVVPEDKTHGAFYFAMAMRAVPALPNGLATFAVVGKGRCFSSGNRNQGFTVCSASGRGQLIDPMDFEMDPLLDSAHLTLESRGFTHEVAWVGEGDAPEAGGGVGAGASGIGAGASIGRWATASGEVFGVELTGRSDVFSFLVQGVMADAWFTTAGYTFHDDGTVSLRRVFR